MSQLSKVYKLFAGHAMFPAGYIGTQIPIKTNVLHRNNSYNPVGIYGGTSKSLITLPDNEIATYWQIVEDCEQFRHLDFTKNILKLLTTDITNLIDDNRPICFIPRLSEKQNKEVEAVLTDHNVRSLIKESINDIVYYGSISYLSKLNKVKGKKKVMFYDLEHPYGTILRYKDGEISYLLPGSNNLEIKSTELIYMGSGNLKLKPIQEDYQPLISEDSSDIDTGILQVKASKAIYHASEPLFYSLIQKIKQYFIKDILSTILSLKDAIQPTILTLNEELTRNGGDTAAFNNAATTLESLINRLSDSSITIAEILDIDVLVNAVFSNLRVLPDPGGTLQNLGALNLEEMKDKLSRIKEGIEDLKKDILESLGIPSDLWDGGSSSQEILIKNERLKDVVFNSLMTVKNSTRKFIYSIIKLVLPDFKVEEAEIELRMFRKSSVEYARESKEVNQLKEGLQTLSETLQSASEIIDNNRFISKSDYYDYLHDALVNISEDYGKLILDKKKVTFDTEDTEDEDKY